MSFNKRLSRIVLVTFVGWISSQSVLAGAPEETATIKVTFKWQGKPPAPKPAAVAGQFCGQQKHNDETFVVNPTNNGIKNIFLYVYTGRRGTKLPDFELQPQTVELDNKNCRFEPHAVFLRVGDTLRVKNSDPVGHNVNIAFFKNRQMGVMVPANQPLDFEMTAAEPAVVPAECNIHPWMRARVLVLEHPFAAISDADGVCQIEGLPAGQKIYFRVNHESLNNSFESIKVNGKQEGWKKNRFELTLKPGMNDLGTVELPWE
ncbi:MAG: methylamine utilization protein [Planctomycetota bacterium]